MSNNHEYLEGFEMDTEIPEVVEVKCREAYDMIFKECDMKNREKTKKYPKSVKAAISIAACAVIAVGGAAAFQVMAEHIPALQNAYEFISGKSYTKDPAKKTNLSEYAEPVNQMEAKQNAEITMQSVYYDGDDLSISFALTPLTDTLKGMTGIDANIKATIGDTELKFDNEDPAYTLMGFTAAEDGNYYGSVHYTIPKGTKGGELKVKLYALKGVNAYVQNYNYKNSSYEPESTELLKDTFEFSKSIEPDASHNKTYEINETQGNVTVESITVTPFKTNVKLSGLEEKQSVRLSDQDGNELEYMNLNDGDMCFVTPLTTSKAINVEIFRLDENDFPTQYTFTTAIDEGFSSKYEVAFEDTFDNSKIVYNPPMEELEKEHDKELKAAIDEAIKDIKVLPLNTPCAIESYCESETSADGFMKGTLDIKITGSKIVDDISGYDFEPDRLNWYGDVDKPDGHNKLLLVTYEIANNTDTDMNMCQFTGYGIVTKDFTMSADCAGDPDYFSVQDHGGKDGYMYDFKANTTREITVGYLVTPEQAEKEFYAVPIDDIDNDYVPEKGARICAID